MTMRSISLVILAAFWLGLAGCNSNKKKEYGLERPLFLPGTTRQVWAVAPAVNLSGQREVDAILQADLLYHQLQQVAGVSAIPVNRVVEVYSSLRIVQVQSEQQASMVCELLGCDALLVPTVTAYDPYDPPKVGASLTLFRKGSVSAKPMHVDPRDLARQAAPTPNESLPARPGFIQAVGMFDASVGSIRYELSRYAAGRNDPAGPYRERQYMVEMDRFSGFAYYSLLEELLGKLAARQ